MLSNVILPLPFTPAVDYDDLLGIDLDQGAADMGAFIVPFKCEVFEAGAVVTETCAGTLKPIVDFDKRPTAGSNASRGAADIGHLLLDTTAAGKVMYDKAAKGTLLEPGEEVVFEIAQRPTDAAAGHCRPYLLVKPVAETDANLADKVETA
jgi:hypothetical protein